MLGFLPSPFVFILVFIIPLVKMVQIAVHKCTSLTITWMNSCACFAISHKSLIFYVVWIFACNDMCLVACIVCFLLLVFLIFLFDEFVQWFVNVYAWIVNIICILNNRCMSIMLFLLAQMLYPRSLPFHSRVVKKKNCDVIVNKTRQCVKALSMTACDLAANTKPWHIQQQTVKVIFDEFYQQVGGAL